MGGWVTHARKARLVLAATSVVPAITQAARRISIRELTKESVKIGMGDVLRALHGEGESMTCISASTVLYVQISSVQRSIEIGGGDEAGGERTGG